jgi:hypothetical protein
MSTRELIGWWITLVAVGVLVVATCANLPALA